MTNPLSPNVSPSGAGSAPLGSTPGGVLCRPAQALGWGPRARAAASALVIVHLVALLVGPISVPPSQLGDFLQRFYRPYLEAAFLNHGYKFFGPDPGPSHLVRYELELADGSRRQGTFPDRAEHRPRLLYHRHFMLSERIAMLGGPGDEPMPWNQQPLSPGQRELARSFARHLLSKYSARRVQLELVEHLLPGPADVLSGMQLSDPRLYRTRALGTFDVGTIDRPTQPQAQTQLDGMNSVLRPTDGMNSVLRLRAGASAEPRPAEARQ